jgi:hypothetical protein
MVTWVPLPTSHTYTIRACVCSKCVATYKQHTARCVQQVQQVRKSVLYTCMCSWWLYMVKECEATHQYVWDCPQCIVHLDTKPWSPSALARGFEWGIYARNVRTYPSRFRMSIRTCARACVRACAHIYTAYPVPYRCRYAYCYLTDIPWHEAWCACIVLV